MDEPARAPVSEPAGAGWDTGSHPDFYRYYAQQSLSPQTLARFQAACDLLLRLAQPAAALDVLDIGCGAGTQSSCWLARGHRYWGLDINEPLIQLARERAMGQPGQAHFEVGSATALPHFDGSMDVCLLPELLEHVADWQSCVDEALRVLRPQGLIYISTSSKLCPRQQEFNLPLYSWYPARLKRYFEQRARTDWPALVNFAKYPAVNWFSYYSLRDYLQPQGFVCFDRFDLADRSVQGLGRRALLRAAAVAPLRWLLHVATPYTLLVGRKS